MDSSYKKNILLVEDEAIIAMSQIKLLKIHGYNVIHVLNGEKAIETVRHGIGKLDLILMDIDLGKGMDGTQAAGEILKKNDIPVVFLSSHTEKEVVEKTEKITSYGYVVKNSGITILDASIKMAFKLFEAHKNINKQNMLIKAGNENLRVTIEQLESNKNRLTSIFRAAPTGIGVVTDRILIEVNQKICEMTGYRKEELIGKTARILYPSREDYDYVGKEKYIQIKEHGTGTVETLWKRKDGEIINVLLSSTPLDTADLKKGVTFTALDITDQVHAEKELEQKTEFLNISQEIAHVGSWFLDIQKNKLSWSDEEYRIFGIENNGTELTYETFLDIVHQEDKEMVNQVYTNAITNNEPYEIVHRIIQPDGTIRSVREKSHNISDDSGKITYSIGMTQDITEQTIIANTIERQESNSNLLIYKLNQKTKELKCLYDVSQLLKNSDKKLEELFIDISKTIPAGWQFPEDIRCKIIFGTKEYVSKPFVQTLLKQSSRLYSNNEIIGQIEIYYIGIWEDTNTPFIQEEQNLLNLIALSLSETIEHRQREEKIRYLLKEKELILKEVHHRIKNNMGTIISLLSLQSGNIESPEAVEALEIAANRIHSMLILYDKLYRGTNFQSISVRDYLTTLTKEIVDNFDTNNSIKVETEIEEFELNSQTIFNLGIITNELITNSMKYAFPQDQAGKITVSASIKNNHITISIGDDGTGIPESVNIETSEGFGFILVNMLSEQLNADIKIERVNGTKFIFGFNL